MGGVGVAYPQDGMASAFNPAGMGVLRKDQAVIGAELFFPDRAAYHDSDLLPANVTSEGNVYLIPSMGGVMRLDRKMVIGMSVIGAGMGTRYNQPPDTFFNFKGYADQQLGVDMKQMQMLPSLSYKINKNHTVGASLALGLQIFKASGLGAFEELGFSSGGGNLTNNGMSTSYGMGVRIGWIGQFLKKKLTLGANVASKVYMTRLEKYQDLFAEGGKFDIPANYAIGLAYKINKKTNVAFDIQRILYNEVPSVGNPGPNAVDLTDFNPLCPGVDTDDCKTGGALGLGFGWTNQTVYKIGIDHKYNKKLTLRTGWNYGKSPIQPNEILFNLIAPATVEHHITLGFTYSPRKSTDINVHYMHAFANTIKGPTAFPPDGLAVIGSNAAAAMKQDAIGVSYGIKF